METTYLLPPDAYYSDEWFEREQRLLFGDTWHLACSAHEVAEPGDYTTIVAGHDPLVVVRGLDGRLAAFHDLCPHRGIQLLDGSGNTRAGISCPYHAWNFSLDGELRNVPQPEQFPDLDHQACALPPAALGEWGGNVFVHPDPSATPLEEWMGAFPTGIGSFRPEELTQVLHFQLPAATNWKFFVENHVDVYHLWYLHSRTLSDFDHNRFEWDQVGRHWVSHEPSKAGLRTRRPAAGSGAVSHIDERDRDGIGAHALFPNILMASEAEYFITYVAVPLGPERMEVDVRVRAEPGADLDAIQKGIEAFVVEDIAACEGIQRAVRSSRYRVGPMAQEHERPITNFQRHLLEVLGE
ncbi:MAG: aromatic ring-hydroxylating dioxygenase subunit alpha [Acidimicrobiales bacterium]|jgi:Rieske 2Fe-2S family protein|nr:aromatic ring-hydroxylating dioxygenase subunit alpha [Acidimicrobiales bacterium]